MNKANIDANLGEEEILNLKKIMKIKTKSM